jgi:hypothetical protein
MHVFHNMHSYGKSENSHEDRQYYLGWPNEFIFSAGHVNQNTVVLNESIEPHSRDFEQSQMLIMTDYTSKSSYRPICDQRQQTTESYSLIRDFEHPRNYSIFKLTKVDGILNLHLNYKDNGFYIGIPRRDDYLLAEIKPNQPLRVTINGKYDFSLTGRRARTFHLLDYLFVYYGEFSEFKVQPWNTISVPRPFPFSPTKHVDLQKILR